MAYSGGGTTTDFFKQVVFNTWWILLFLWIQLNLWGWIIFILDEIDSSV